VAKVTAIAMHSKIMLAVIGVIAFLVLDGSIVER
jgi:hypothetical protein